MRTSTPPKPPAAAKQSHSSPSCPLPPPTSPLPPTPTATPPRPPRPEVSLPNLRPTILLSPISIPVQYYSLPSLVEPSGPARKTKSFSEDVFASLASIQRLKPESHANNSPRLCWPSLPPPPPPQFSNHHASISGPPHTHISLFALPDAVRTSKTKANCLVRAVPSDSDSYASSTRLPGTIQCSNSDVTSAMSGDLESAIHKDRERASTVFKDTSSRRYVSCVPGDWVHEHKRALWIATTLLFSVLATSGIAGGIIWKLSDIST